MQLFLRKALRKRSQNCDSGVPDLVSSRFCAGASAVIKVRKREPAISRVLSLTTIHLGQPSPAASSDLPGSPLGTGSMLPYLVLLRAGFTVPRTVTSRAVRSYRTFSPLPSLAVYFLWHFPWARALQALPGALSEGARTFLCRLVPAAIAWPTPAFSNP